MQNEGGESRATKEYPLQQRSPSPSRNRETVVLPRPPGVTAPGPASPPPLCVSDLAGGSQAVAMERARDGVDLARAAPAPPARRGGNSTARCSAQLDGAGEG
jgi:hypothetical protein